MKTFLILERAPYNMKNHAIIPIFIPHLGCPHDCIFCNQKKITNKDQAVSVNNVREIIESYLKTLENRNIKTIEVAFYGGSFTAIPLNMQSAYLEVAKEYKVLGRIDKIHLSTRPDCIDEEILDNLKKYYVDIIELGVQSLDETVLIASKRGHTVEDVLNASNLIKKYGFVLGIQLMIGLPGSDYEKDIYSANETVKIAPKLSRLYPTVVLEDTELYQLYKNKQFRMLSENEAISRSKDMYLILESNNIQVIRIGLKNTFGAYHPAFRQLVEAEAAKEILERKLFPIEKHKGNKITFWSNEKYYSNLLGNKKSNLYYFKEKYPEMNFYFKINNELEDLEYTIKIGEE